jgi:hypothetical protein
MPPTQKDHVQTGLKRPPGSFSEDPARPGDHAGEAGFKKRRTDQQTLLRAGHTSTARSNSGSELHQFSSISYLNPREHVESPPVSPMSKPLDGPASATDSGCSSTPSRGQDLKASRS